MMLNLYELQQFIAFAELGTLSNVSKRFHLSTPSITRSMQNIEESFKVKLFNRSANKIELNETGKKAVELSKKLMAEIDTTIKEVQLFDQSLKTIAIKSSAPLPLWKLLPSISENFPSQTIISNIMSTEDVLNSIETGEFDIAILPFELKNSIYHSRKFLTEKLFISVVENDLLAEKKEVSFQDINGYNFLIRSKLGFWDKLCREKMPSSRFLVQDNDFEFEELVKNSSLPKFITDVSDDFINNKYNRINIPIIDKEANITFYLVIKDHKLYKTLFKD